MKSIYATVLISAMSLGACAHETTGAKASMAKAVAESGQSAVLEDLSAKISLPDGPRNGADTLDLADRSGKVIQRLSCGAGLGSEAGPVTLECEGGQYYVTGAFAFAHIGEAWSGDLSVNTFSSDRSSLVFLKKLNCLGNVRTSADAINLDCWTETATRAGSVTTGVRSSVNLTVGGSAAPAVSINYFDTSSYFSRAAAISAYVEIHKVEAFTGRRSVEKATIALPSNSPDEGRSYGVNLSPALTDGEFVEFLVVAFSDSLGKKWDSNSGHNYRLSPK